MIEILDPGPATTVQDLGRPGYAAFGVPVSGAFDRHALASANRLVGNAPGAAAFEITLGGLAVRLVDAHTLAFTGAPCPGAPDWWSPVTLPAGAVIRLRPPGTGLRSYLAVRGGLDVPATLGSAATDTLSGLGPAPLRAGDRYDIVPGTASGTVAGSTAVPGRRDGPLPVVPGPRDDWFAASAVPDLLATGWTVRAASDRVGVRLDGPALQRARSGELPSEAVLPGAVQVPPGGRPIVFGPDAPVTGGYPVIAVVADVDRLAQVRPGDTLRFTLAR